MTPSVVLLAGLLLPAEPPVVEDAPLRWVADKTHCPSAAEVRDAVVELAGRWPRRDELQVEAFLQPSDARWQLSLTMVVGGRVHRQELEADSCAALARAAALIVAVSIDPVASASAAKVSVAPAPSEPRPIETRASAEPPDSEPDPGPEPEPERRHVEPFVGGSWGVVTGMTPSLSSGPALALGVALEHSRFEVMGRYVLPRTATQSGREAQIQAGVVAARACLSSRPGRIRGLLCGGLEAGALRARGRRVSNPRTQQFPWLAGLVRGGLRWQLAQRWALAADVEGSVSAFDAQVVTGNALDSDASRLFETPRIGVRGMLGVEFSISRPGK